MNRIKRNKNTKKFLLINNSIKLLKFNWKWQITDKITEVKRSHLLDLIFYCLLKLVYLCLFVYCYPILHACVCMLFYIAHFTLERGRIIICCLFVNIVFLLLLLVFLICYFDCLFVCFCFDV